MSYITLVRHPWRFVIRENDPSGETIASFFQILISFKKIESLLIVSPLGR